MDLETGFWGGLSNLPEVSPPFSDSNSFLDCPRLSASEGLDKRS